QKQITEYAEIGYEVSCEKQARHEEASGLDVSGDGEIERLLRIFPQGNKAFELVSGSEWCGDLFEIRRNDFRIIILRISEAPAEPVEKAFERKRVPQWTDVGESDKLLGFKIEEAKRTAPFFYRYWRQWLGRRKNIRRLRGFAGRWRRSIKDSLGRSGRIGL